MPLIAMIAAVAALLLTPGPTNTLLAVAGAERGWRAALRLIPFELVAYLAVTVPLALAGAALEARLPLLRPALAGLAGIWVMVLAARMWRLPAAAGLGSVSGWQVLVTTALNPKALVIGLVLLPGAMFGLRVLALSVLIACVAALWAALGWLATGNPARPAADAGSGAAQVARRLAALWLAALSLGLIYTAAHAAF